MNSDKFSLKFELRPRAAEALPETEEATEEKVKEAFAKNWNVIVWNDPVNLMSYVVFVFMKVLAFPKEKATKHMLEVHHAGKSCVATETRYPFHLIRAAVLRHQRLPVNLPPARPCGRG